MHKKKTESALEKPKIAVIDSGAGGLSIVIEILNMIKHIDVFYLADKANFPYGNRDSQTLIEQLCEQVNVLIQQCDPDVIVIACNTASTMALEHLRRRFTVPFVGVVPAVKPAAQISKTRSFAVLATPNTVNTPYTKNLVAEFASDCMVSYVGSTELVSIAEQYIYGSDPCIQTIRSILQASFVDNPRIDALVLACTHFPLIKDQIQDGASSLSALAPKKSNHKKIHNLDSGHAIARRVKHILTEGNVKQSLRIQDQLLQAMSLNSTEESSGSVDRDNTELTRASITLLFTSRLSPKKAAYEQLLIDSKAYEQFLLSKLSHKAIFKEAKLVSS